MNSRNFQKALISIRILALCSFGGGTGSNGATNIPQTTIYSFDQAALPSIGKTLAGQDISLGGLSGLRFEGITPGSGKYRFITHTDRGPNAEATNIVRPFLLPNYQPQIVRFELDRATGSLKITERILLQKSPGVPLSGLPNTGLSTNPDQSYNDEVPVDLLGKQLPLDPLGADLEGMAVDPRDGSFWMADEYRPAIFHFNSAGVMIDRFVPIGAAAAAGSPPGTYGTEVLPAVLAQRRQNRGFEAIAWDNGKVYAFAQSPIRNPSSLGNGPLVAMRNIRIVEFDPETRQTRQFIYVLDNPDLGPEPNTRADKIGDAASLEKGEFLVIERDDDALPGDELSVVEKKVYRFKLSGATDVSSRTGTIGSTGKTVDQMTIAEMIANQIQPVEKVLHADLARAGYSHAQKVEGLTVVDQQTIAVINDNDFTVARITVHPDGSFTRNYVPESIQLGIIHLSPKGVKTTGRD